MKISFFILGIFLSFNQTIYSADCTGPKEYNLKKYRCDFQIKYPTLPNENMECKIREWLNKDFANLKDESGQDGTDNEGAHVSYIADYVLMNPNPKSQSVVFKIFEDGGGAHGTDKYKTFTYEVEPGSLINIADIFKPSVDYIGLLSPYVSKKLESANSIGDDQIESLTLPVSDSSRITSLLSGYPILVSFAIEGEGQVLHLYFDQGVITSQMYGSIEIDIDMNDISDKLNESFFHPIFKDTSSITKEDKFKYFLALAKKNLEEKKYVVAIDCYKQSIKLNANNDKVWVYLGYAHIQNTEPWLADEAFKKAIKLNPNSELAYYNKALNHWLYKDGYQMMGYSQAISELQEALKLEPTLIDKVKDDSKFRDILKTEEFLKSIKNN